MRYLELTDLNPDWCDGDCSGEATITTRGRTPSGRLATRHWCDKCFLQALKRADAIQGQTVLMVYLLPPRKDSPVSVNTGGF